MQCIKYLFLSNAHRARNFDVDNRLKLSLAAAQQMRIYSMVKAATLAGFFWFCILFLQGVNSFAAEGESRFAIPSTDEGLPGVGPIRRYEWFQNLWQSRRSSWAETIELDQGAVVFLGDSIMQGWGGGLSAAFPGMKVANRGISGDTSRGVLIRLEEDVFAVNPTAVVLLIGTNDLEENAALEVITDNVQLILDAISSFNPEMPIIFCEVMPSSSLMSRPTAQIQRVNALYRELLSDYPQLTRLDTFSLFDNGEGNADPKEFPDLLHPNEIGYAKWAEALRPALRRLGLIESE